MEHKPKYGWLYILIVLCVLFSAVMAWTLIDKLAQQRESAQVYANLSSEAIETGETGFHGEIPTPAVLTAPSEEEAVDQNDTLFYLDHDVVKSADIGANDQQPSAVVETAAVLTVAVESTQTEAPVPSARVVQAAATQKGKSETTVAPTATVAPTIFSTASPDITLAQALTETPGTAQPGTTASTGSGWALVTSTPVKTAEAVPTAAETVAGGYFYLPPTATPGQNIRNGAALSDTKTTEATALSAVTASATTLASLSGLTATPSATLTSEATLTPLATNAPTPSPTIPETQTPSPADAERSRVVMTDKVRYSVDFPYLQTVNEDVKAWIVQDNTPINYPVVQGKDNDYYLNHLFNRSVNKDGAIFLDSGSSATFSDANLYLYGHHTKTDSMFSTLAEYRDQTYYEAHPQMTLLTPYSDYCIDLFAAAVFEASDENTWRVKQFSRKTEFDTYIQQLEEASLFKPHADATPEWGDQLLVLVTCTNNQHGERYVLYGRMRRLMYASAENVAVTKIAMDEKPTLTAWEEVPGRGKMLVYAQNDPLWSDMRYESPTANTRRIFGSGGCGPTSVAMAVVNLVPEERLGDIFGYAKSSAGYVFSENAVNQYSDNKMQYQVQTPDEYLRYYPLVMAGFATGNNLWGEVSRGSASGTSLKFVKRVAFLYKLNLAYTGKEDEALQAVRNGALAVSNLGQFNPFTGGGHYIVMASVDDQYAYFLDPYRQENYDRFDSKHLLTSIAPGVVRVKLEDVKKLCIGTSYLLTATAKTATNDLPAVKR